MDENKNIDNKIKTIFDGLDKEAPEDLWNKFSERLPVSDTDKTIEAKVKEGFENMNQTAPDHIWGTVNKQLNIDKVWERISGELDRRRILYWRNVAALILGILFLAGVSVYKYSEKNELVILNVEQVAKQNAKNKVPDAAIKASQRTEQHLITNNSKHTYQTTNIGVAVSQSKNKIYGSNNQKTTNVSTGHSDLITENAVENDIADVPANDIMNAEFLDPLMPPMLLANQDMASVDISNSTYANNALDTGLLKNDLAVKQKRFEIGATYSFNNTWLLNNETQSGFNSNSLTQTFLAFGSSYGLVANYNLSKFNALSSEFYFNSTSRQQYGEYIEGNYSTHTLQFNYAKITLLYQLNIDQAHYRRISSRYTFKAGLYGSYLKDYNYSYSKVNFINTDSYKSHDYGIKIAMGQEKIMRQFIFGYGLNAEYGFNNTYAGNKQVPSDFNITKNALVGAYFNIKYAF